jgi:hypothetical protein
VHGRNEEVSGKAFVLPIYEHGGVESRYLSLLDTEAVAPTLSKFKLAHLNSLSLAPQCPVQSRRLPLLIDREYRLGHPFNLKHHSMMAKSRYYSIHSNHTVK